MKVMDRVEKLLDKINPWYAAALAALSPIIGALAANWGSFRWNRLIWVFVYLGIGVLFNRISCCPIRGDIRPISYVILAYGWPFYLLIVIPIMVEMDYKTINKRSKNHISVWKVLILELIANTHWRVILCTKWGINDADITGG